MLSGSDSLNWPKEAVSREGGRVIYRYLHVVRANPQTFNREVIIVKGAKK